MGSITFSQLHLYTFDKANPQEIQLTSDKALKIESIGIAGTGGTVYLRTLTGDPLAPTNIAILFTTIDENDYGATMPFWLPPGFEGWLFNDSPHLCAVSVTEYDFTA